MCRVSLRYEQSPVFMDCAALASLSGAHDRQDRLGCRNRLLPYCILIRSKSPKFDRIRYTVI